MNLGGIEAQSCATATAEVSFLLRHSVAIFIIQVWILNPTPHPDCLYFVPNSKPFLKEYIKPSVSILLSLIEDL